jgi:iron complex outermembrane receptor protein
VAGDFGRLEVRGMANLAISSRAAIRFAGAFRREDGEGRRLLAGGRLGGQEVAYARGRLRWEPADRFRIDLSADYTERNDESPVSALTAVGGPSAVGAPGTLFTGLLYNNLIQGPDGVAPCERSDFAFPFCGLPGLIQLPALPASTVPFDARWLTGNLFESLGTGPTGSDFNGGGATLTVEFQAPVSVRSTSAYRRFRAAFGRDPDNAPLVMIDTANQLEHEQVSQEFQLRHDGTSIDWVGGLYYFREEGSDRVTAPFVEETFSTINRLGLGCTLLPAATGLPDPLFLPICPNIFRIDFADDGTHVENQSLAAYGEATLQVTDWLSVSGGLRWTRDRKTIDVSGFLVGGAPVSPNPVARRIFSRLTPRVIIQAQPRRGSMAYISWSTGFKSGGFNQRYGAPIAEPTSFEPESVRSFELGFRLWRPREGIRIGATGFWSDYREIQAVVFDGGIPRTVNAAQGRSRGIELEASWAPASALTLSASYGWLDARFTRLDAAIIGSFGTPIVNPLRLDNRFVNSPRHSLAFSAAYRFEAGRIGSFQLRGDVSHRSSVVNDAVNTPELIQGPVTLVNARLSWSLRGGNWSAALFGTNLLDEVYVISGAADPVGFGAAEINAAQTRRWGISVQFAW